MPAKEIAALQSHMVDDLPLPKQVEVTAVSETGEEKSFQISLQYDTTAYERVMQTHKPFCMVLQIKVVANESISLSMRFPFISSPTANLYLICHCI